MEDLKERRREVNNIISSQESERATLESSVKSLQDKLAGLNKSLSYHKTLKESYDRTIKDTEAGFKKVTTTTLVTNVHLFKRQISQILEGSQTLLNLVQTEVDKLNETTKKVSLDL